MAEGVRYIHSEGIVHGDLRGVRILISYLGHYLNLTRQGNVLLDAENRCRITADVGSAQHSNGLVTLSTVVRFFNYAAPELFLMQLENNDHGGYEEQYGSKTMQTDVYSFGCLYYAVRSTCSSTI